MRIDDPGLPPLFQPATSNTDAVRGPYDWRPFLEASMHVARVFCSLTFFAAAGPLKAQAPEAERLVRDYLAAQEAVMREGAGDAELEKDTAFLADSVVYDHPRAGAHLVGKAVIADGLRAFLGTTRQAHISVLHLVAGPAVVVVEEQVSFEARDSARWTPYTRTQVSVFELARGRITHVVEFWQPH